MSFTHDGVGTSASVWSDWLADVDLPPLRLDDGAIHRVVVVAAHPDDESLGAGGLVAQAHRRGLEVTVVLATDGEGSHPSSPTHPPDVLAARRRREMVAAVEAVAPGGRLECLGLPDGSLADHEDVVATRLVEVVADGSATLLVAPWRSDGHPDHEAAGRAASTAAVRTGARFLEYPVWFWHWAEPPTAPTTMLRLDLDPSDVESKRRAVRCHLTQVEPLSDRSGDEALLTPSFLAHFARGTEVFVDEPAGDRALDDLHADRSDPWGTDRRWYERRKRDLLLAALPRQRFASALEVGCSAGALAQDLVGRCDRLLAVDSSERAVALATRRLADDVSAGRARVERADLPADWPAGESFDLVVLSEVGYFLSPAALEQLADRVRSALTDDGVLVLCHWRHPVSGWVLDGPDVPRFFTGPGFPPVVARYVDRDVEIVLLADPSVLPDPRG